MKNPSTPARIGQDIPVELQAFNWAAFLGNWLWAIHHGIWVAFVPCLLLLIGVMTGFPPLICISLVFTILTPFALGLYGNAWAWKKRGYYSSPDIFLEQQRQWKRNIFIIFASILFNEWTWKKKYYWSFPDIFLEQQRQWRRNIFIIFFASIVVIVFYYLNFSSMVKIPIQIASKEEEIVQYLGDSIVKSKYLGKISCEWNDRGKRIESHFTVKGTRNEGDLHMIIFMNDDNIIVKKLLLEDLDGNVIYNRTNFYYQYKGVFV
ncbi:MAG: hypothetical protein FJ161_01755 [Gammaproteobacteria bacterium]|nr:hypothetical protein [Gammaproteobacteria bacterium]